MSSSTTLVTSPEPPESGDLVVLEADPRRHRPRCRAIARGYRDGWLTVEPLTDDWPDCPKNNRMQPVLHYVRAQHLEIVYSRGFAQRGVLSQMEALQSSLAYMRDRGPVR